MQSFMQAALRLAKKSRGTTTPNPMVGAVVVKNGKIIAQGYHQRAGGPHAEISALNQAGSRARGAQLYVNLEPCIHHGRTPPCVPEIIASGVSEAHIAMYDPNPRVNEKGVAALQKADISVHVGECEKEAKTLNEVFVTNMEKKRPFVTAKFAMSLDGKIATKTGDAKWISTEKSRAFVHTLRSRVDAVIVGIGTVLADNPRLTARKPRQTRKPGKTARQPLRIILDTHGRTPLDAHVLSAGLSGHTLLVTKKDLSAKKIRNFQKHGAEVIRVAQTGHGVDLPNLMDMLLLRGITSVLVEGGGETLASFFAAGLVDTVHAFIAPKIIGGKSAITAVEGIGVARIDQAVVLSDMRVKKIDKDVLVSANTRYSI